MSKCANHQFNIRFPDI